MDLSGDIEQHILEVVEKKWKEIKPSQQAQLIRSKIKIDSGLYSQSESDMMVSYAWPLVDIAIQQTLNDLNDKGKLK